MTPAKRCLDLLSACFLGVVLLPVGLCVAALLLLREGRPVFYRSERMKTATTGFTLIKFRTMHVVTTDSGVSGGDKTNRITPTGQFLRRTRLDELPQIWNVLRGDISFVGPRPPLRRYVEQFPEIYGKVLESRPGITGLATLCFHRTEERLLAPCTSGVETEEVYIRRCIPRKAQLDLIYARNRTVCFDLRLMAGTVIRPLSPCACAVFRANDQK